jgi:hypothetical protein
MNASEENITYDYMHDALLEMKHIKQVELILVVATGSCFKV